MRIAICEDEEVIAKKLWNYFFEKNEIEAKYYLNPLELLQQYQSGEKYDVLFCDISMKPMSGIELSGKIRKLDPDVYIVFITNYIEYAPRGYEVRAFRYLLKPVTESAMEKVLQEIREDMAKNSKVLIKTAEGNIVLNERDILYIEIQDKESFIHYSEEEVLVLAKSLGEIEECLTGDSFYRVHRKYLVNLERVREFDQNRLTMDNGKSLPISKRRAADFKKALYDFL